MEVKAKGPLGYLVRVDNQYDGMLYHNDIFKEPPKVGDHVDGWLLKVRDDGKVDVSLRPPGAVAKISEGVELILDACAKNGDRLPLGDKSSPKEIYQMLGLSKKVFKEALGHMYKRRMVVLGDREVVLQDMAEWKTGIVGSREEKKAVSEELARAEKSKQPAAAGAAGARGAKAKKPRKSQAKSLYMETYRPQPVVPLPEHLLKMQKESSKPWENERLEGQVGEESGPMGSVKEQVLARRALVEAALMEDAQHLKLQAKEQLEKKKQERLAKLQREHEQWRRAARREAGESEAVSAEEQQRRKALLQSSRGSQGSGIKATMERMRALKAIKGKEALDASLGNTKTRISRVAVPDVINGGQAPAQSINGGASPTPPSQAAQFVRR